MNSCCSRTCHETALCSFYLGAGWISVQLLCLHRLQGSNSCVCRTSVPPSSLDWLLPRTFLTLLPSLLTAGQNFALTPTCFDSGSTTGPSRALHWDLVTDGTSQNLAEALWPHCSHQNLNMYTQCRMVKAFWLIYTLVFNNRLSKTVLCPRFSKCVLRFPFGNSCSMGCVE